MPYIFRLFWYQNDRSAMKSKTKNKQMNFVLIKMHRTHPWPPLSTFFAINFILIDFFFVCVRQCNKLYFQVNWFSSFFFSLFNKSPKSFDWQVSASKFTNMHTALLFNSLYSKSWLLFGWVPRYNKNNMLALNDWIWQVIIKEMTLFAWMSMFWISRKRRPPKNTPRFSLFFRQLKV